jgi:hypothetical protein
MPAQPRIIQVQEDTTLAAVLDAADNDPVLVERNGARYRVEYEPVDLFADYDAEATLNALRSMFGALKNPDRASLKMRLHAQREQDSAEGLG